LASSHWMPSAAESSLLFAAASWTVGPGVIPERVRGRHARLQGVGGTTMLQRRDDRRRRRTDDGSAQGSTPDPQQTEGAGTPPRSVAVLRHINAAARDVDGCPTPLTIVKPECRESDVPTEHRLQAAPSGVALPMVSTGPGCHGRAWQALDPAGERGSSACRAAGPARTTKASLPGPDDEVRRPQFASRCAPSPSGAASHASDHVVA
jgi:hypothetical protein